eukprot:CAMPEP_0178918282 /NCGR_PEP_ID=MMETSP0786-20121207/13745_1 /TAXON_ID=186022 /ORGANISM="Thalassionema frauenfeldii, Strain CCMP 1798" /LENGTH=721 /DNA_ID=CAMNT_0020591985 /DNA_START=354 /DNA_END=2519 /DNA_ORIENTATION=-
MEVFDPPHLIWTATGPRLRRLVADTDRVFGGLPISTRDFQEVRKTYTTKDEIHRRLEVVKLPDDFGRQKSHLNNIEEFSKFAAGLFQDNISLPQKKSNIAIVSICIGMDLCDLTPQNHKYYAASHGYDYILLDKALEGVHPKMLKYPLLSLVMDQGYEWVMMMDADALFTNVNTTIPSLLQGLSPSNTTSLIATRGGQWKNFHIINNGIFFLKTGEWAKKHCFDIYTAKWSYTRFLSKTLIDQPLQASILLANGDVEWPPKDEVEKGKNVMIVAKRAFNSFRRNDSRYNNTLSNDELEDSAWKKGDFIAHFPASNKLSLMIQLLEEEGMNELLPKVEERFPFSLPAPGKSNGAGHCWCDKDSLHCMPSYHIIGAQRAGSKILTAYLEYHPEVSSSYNKDPTHWLVDTATESKIKKCAKLSKKKLPGILTKRGVDDPRHMSTCALEDYSLHHGKSVSEQGCTCKNGALTQSPTKPLFDELFIWDYTFDHIRGVPLPELLHRLQPDARLLFPVRNPAEVVYSMYSASKDIQEENKSPEHFELFMRNATETWSSLGCTAANYRKCLPVELVKVGQWLSQGMYSQHLAQWLKHFPSSQVHIFDSSNVVDDEAKRLNKFMGLPSANSTTRNLHVSKEVDTEEGKSLSPQPSTKDTGSEHTTAAPTEASTPVFYEKMNPQTKRLLYEFYNPYQKEACHLLKKYRSVRLPFFKALCANSKPVNTTKTY